MFPFTNQSNWRVWSWPIDKLFFWGSSSFRKLFGRDAVYLFADGIWFWLLKLYIWYIYDILYIYEINYTNFVDTPRSAFQRALRSACGQPWFQPCCVQWHLCQCQGIRPWAQLLRAWGSPERTQLSQIDADWFVGFSWILQWFSMMDIHGLEMTSNWTPHSWTWSRKRREYFDPRAAELSAGSRWTLSREVNAPGEKS